MLGGYVRGTRGWSFLLACGFPNMASLPFVLFMLLSAVVITAKCPELNLTLYSRLIAPLVGNGLLHISYTGVDRTDRAAGLSNMAQAFLLHRSIQNLFNGGEVVVLITVGSCRVCCENTSYQPYRYYKATRTQIYLLFSTHHLRLHRYAQPPVVVANLAWERLIA
jgi:hypothetical protein